MPFDFKKFDAKCANMTPDELQREWEHYTRLISGSATSTAVSGAAIPFTIGVSVIGVGLAAPAIHNARKKREIIERHLQRLGTTHHTRKRDVLAPMAISGTVGLVTLGVGSAGAGAITNAAVEHGITSVAANEIAVKATVHLAVDGVAMAGEGHHMKRKRLAEAHNAWLKQQHVKMGNPKKTDQSNIVAYNPSNTDNQSRPVTTIGLPGDIKYEYSPVPIPSPVTEPVLPPYSPPSHDVYKNHFPPPQQYSEKPTLDNTTTYYSQSPQNLDAKATYYAPPPPPPPESTQTRPQPYPIQIPPGQTQFSQHGEPMTANTIVHEGSSLSTQQHSLSITETPTGQWMQQAQNVYPQTPVQQTPQLMYTSYPTSIIPESAHQQYGRLDQVMSELSLSSMPPPPPPPPRTQMWSPELPVPTSKPPAPTSRGYCSQTQQAPEQSGSYFPPPSPNASTSSVCYQKPVYTPCLSPPSDQHPPLAIPSRAPSISSFGSYQPYSPVQEPLSSSNQYGYMTPIPTPGSQYDQSSAQRYNSTSSQYPTQTSPQSPAPGSTNFSYRTGYPTPAQTPAYSQPATPNDYVQSSPQQPGFAQASYSQNSSQAPIQGQWQIPHTFGNTYSPPNVDQGYPTPAATPSHKTEQYKQPIYFPPPPAQPTR